MLLSNTHRNTQKHWRPEEVKIIDGRAVRFRDVCVHTIMMADCDDPEIHLAEPIWNWQQTEQGVWVMSHAVEAPYYMQVNDFNSWTTKFSIIARLSEPNELFFKLKFK